MGAKQSAAAKENNAGTNDGTSAPAPLLKFGVILQGVSGAGVSAVQTAAALPDGRVLHVDDQFLTSPPIYSLEWNSPNYPGYGFGGEDNKRDDSVWEYGGRGGVSAVWQMAAYLTRAVVFVVDSTDRARLARTASSPPLQPDSFVENYMSNSAEKRAEILATLRADMTAKETLHRLIKQNGAKHKPVLVLATKQDQPGAIPPGEIAALLDLPSLVGVDWRLSGCNALTGEGLAEAMHWLTHVVNVPTNFEAERERERQEDRAKREAKWRAEVEDEAAAMQKKKEQADTSANADTHQPKETDEEDSTPHASTPTPTPSAETNGEPAVEIVAVVTDSKPEGQRSATPTPSETSGEVVLQAKVVAEGAEGAAADVTITGAFDSLSSTYVVLPALQAPQPEPVEMERRKKHWYSRAKYVPKKNPLDVYTRSSHRSGLM